MPPPGSSSPEAEIRPPRDETEFEAALRLRWAVLRAPWGQPRGSERDAHEHDAFHLVAVTPQGEVVGTARLHREDRETGRIRYMAVHPDWRGLGLGRALLAGLEAEARRRGLKRIRLDAREAVADFYQRHGYRALGPGHILFGRIRHLRMQRRLD